MAKHVIFIIHGAGTYPAGGASTWFTRVETALKRLFDTKRYKIYATRPDVYEWGKQFEIVNLSYDEIFEDIIQDWAETATYYLDQGLANGGIFKTVFDFFAKGDAKTSNFLRNNAADVVLYAAMGKSGGPIREAIVGKIRADIEARFKQGDVDRWSVIAHSLGTAVAHDVLCNIEGADYLAASGGPTLVAMLANLSQVMPASKYGSAYAETLAPGGFVRNFLSAGHKLDPVCSFRVFSPGAAWKFERDPGRTPPERFYKETNLDHFILPDPPPDGVKSVADALKIENLIVHDVVHYLEHPRVHLNMFKALLPRLRISQADILAADAAFKDRTESAIREAFNDKFAHLSFGGGDSDARSLFDFLSVANGGWKK